MIEELDRPGLTHGKLLFPFNMVRALPACGDQASLESGKRNRVASHGASAENLHPGSQSARKTPHSRGASPPSARPIYPYAFPESADAKCLIRIGVVERSAVERLGREVEMGSEVLRSGGHLGRPPDVAEPQRIAANACGPALHVIAVRIAALLRSIPFGPLLGFRAQRRAKHKNRARQESCESKRLAKGGKLGHVTC